MKINVRHIAKLANLELKEKELEDLEKQLSAIIGYIENLQAVDTQNVTETSQVTGLENITREDVPGSSLTQEDAVSNTKSEENGLFKVKAIFKEQ